MVVGILLSYWEGNFSGAMLNFRGVLKISSDDLCTSEIEEAPPIQVESSTGSVVTSHLFSPWDKMHPRNMSRTPSHPGARNNPIQGSIGLKSLDVIYVCDTSRIKQVHSGNQT